jgi:hypothetical protein
MLIAPSHLASCMYIGNVATACLQFLHSGMLYPLWSPFPGTTSSVSPSVFAPASSTMWQYTAACCPREDGVSQSDRCRRRRDGVNNLAQGLNRVAVAHLHDGDAPARHRVAQLHARVRPGHSEILVSKSNIKDIQRKPSNSY